MQPQPPPNRDYYKGLYLLFQRFALEDQRKYYERTSNRYRQAASQVNVLRAFFAFITGLSSALGGVIVAAYIVPGSFANNGACATRDVIATVQGASQTIPGGETDPQATQSPEANLNLTQEQEATIVRAAEVGYCDNLKIFIGLLMIISVVAPALGAAATTLADLYQWDRMTAIYDAALENIEVADAQSPMDDMDELTYRAALRAMVEGTLTVMSDETAQWGQSVRTPAQLDKFIEEERTKLERSSSNRQAQSTTTSGDTNIPG